MNRWDFRPLLKFGGPSFSVPPLWHVTVSILRPWISRDVCIYSDSGFRTLIERARNLLILEGLGKEAWARPAGPSASLWAMGSLAVQALVTSPKNPSGALLPSHARLTEPPSGIQNTPQKPSRPNGVAFLSLFLRLIFFSLALLSLF